MRRITTALFSHSEVDDMVRETLRVAIDVLQADVGSVQLHDAETDTLVFRYVMDPRAQNLVGHSYPTAQGIGGRVFRSGVADLTNKVAERAEFNRAVDDLTGYHTESILTAPLKHFEGEPLGIVQVLNARRPFDERDLEVLEVLTAQAAAAIESAQLIERARKAETVTIIGDISHDIKNMLTPIQSGVQTLQPMLDDLFQGLDEIRSTCPQAEPWGERMAQTMSFVRDDYGWILEAALEAVDRLQARTKEIADAVKGESAPPCFEPGDINETARTVLQDLRLVAEQAGLRLVADLDPQLPEVEFDQTRLYNALYNLVDNAIPETPAGGSITLRTRAAQESTDQERAGEGAANEMILIEVADTGRGMSEEVRRRWGTTAAKSTKQGGTGLGSRIVQDAIRRHNGQVTVASAVGHGSTFSIHLPLRQPPAA